MPRPVAVFFHPDCLLHETGTQHPERPERCTAIRAALTAAPFAQHLQWFAPKPVAARWIDSIHSPEYRAFVEESCLRGKPFADFGDTVICPESYHAALLAAGAATAAVDAVMQDGFTTAFSLCRPPGHHARAEQAMGFCLFNNVAIAAAYAEQTYGLERVCILDWDVHHGNGTQDAFFVSPSVLFVSVHQLPLFPHSGEAHECGAHTGANLTLNCPLPPGSALGDVLAILNEVAAPRIEAFQPELFILSAGFDAHRLDPLADFQLESEDFFSLTVWLRNFADRFAKGRIVSVLEGGYHLDALAASAAQHVAALIEDQPR